MFPYLKFLSEYWRKDRGKIGLIFLFVMLSQIFSLAEPFFFTRILDGFLRQVGDAIRFPTEAIFFHQITIVVLGWIGVAFAARVFKNLQLYFVETVSDRVGINIFQAAYRKIVDLPMSFHESQKPGEVFRKVSKARDDITQLFSIFFDKIFQNIFSIALVIIYVFYRSWQIGVALIGFVPVFFLVTYFFTKRIKKAQNEINAVNEKLYGTSLEAINNIEVVKAFSTEDEELKRTLHDNQLSHKSLKIKTVATQQLTFWQGTVVNAARVVLLWYGSLLAFRGVVSFGDVVLFTFYSFAIYQPLYEIGSVYSKYHEGINAVDRLQSVLKEPQTVRDSPDAKEVRKLKGEVEFRNVSFSYSKNGRNILKDISFRVSPGQKLAVVGLSGGGKSTIIKLLLRFYEATDGEILIDGERIANYDTTTLRRRIGLVMQENVLFNATLAENIRYGTFEATNEQVRQAAKAAHLQDLLAKLPEGLDTMVGEKGHKLSGGERQRVAIARAIIKQPDILIFDEATSNLDSHSETKIKEAMQEVSSGRASITVAHRFATVIDADEIVLLRDGRMVERGTHLRLIAKKGLYSQLYNLQTQRHEG